MTLKRKTMRRNEKEGEGGRRRRGEEGKGRKKKRIDGNRSEEKGGRNRTS